MSKSEQVEIVNNYTELVSNSGSLNIKDLQDHVFHDQGILNMFED